jgi:hypothetical protein
VSYSPYAVYRTRLSGRLAAIRRASVHLGAQLGSKPGRLCRPVATNPAVSAHLRVAKRSLYVLRQCGLGIPNLPAAKAENLASGTASSATQCRSNPVFGRRLPKTGIFQISGGDCRLILRESGQIWSPETDGGFVKARHWRAFPALLGAKSPGVGVPGWGGSSHIERNST